MSAMFKRRSVLGILAVAATWAVAGQAHGQFTDFQGLLFRGLDFTGNHNYLSNPQGGPLFDNNIFDQRVEFNRLGQGFTYEQFRFFGPDSFDNPNTFDLGPLKLQLGRDPAVLQSGQPVGIHNRIGFTKTILPEITFSSRTGQRAFDIFSGQTQFTPAPLHYDLSFTTGVQDYNWNGNILVDSNGKVNALGFYDLTLRVTNVGNATADGVVLQDESVTDFDTGPVHVSGNIVFDAIASFFQADGALGAAAPFRILSGATKDKNTDELLARLEAGEKLSDDDMGYLLQQMFITAFLNDPLGFLQNGMPSTVPGFEGLSLDTYEPPATGLDPGYVDAAHSVTGSTTDAAASSTIASSVSVPEPGTLVFLAMAVSTLGVMRSMHRRFR
jgi:hypothetical protein